MKTTVLLLAVFMAIALATGVYAQSDNVVHASAILKDTNGTEVGQARFTEDDNGLVRIEVYVKGISPGSHGIHIHEAGNCSPPFASAGSHYNPLGKHHGLKNPEGAHAGDLPEILVNETGEGYLSTTTGRVTLSPGPTTIFDSDGSALVIHARPDDQMTDPAGNSGERIACGVIEAY
jgi:Cu-Zn family superoxide dismutase